MNFLASVREFFCSSGAGCGAPLHTEIFSLNDDLSPQQCPKFFLVLLLGCSEHTQVWALLINRALFEFSGGQGCIRSKRNGSPDAGVGSNFANWILVTTPPWDVSGIECLTSEIYHMSEEPFLGGR